MENRIKFKIKTVKLFGSTKSNMTKNENGENMPHLEINKAALVIAILSTIIINMIQESCVDLFLINCLVNHSTFLVKILCFEKNLVQNLYIFKYRLLIKILNLEG